MKCRLVRRGGRLVIIVVAILAAAAARHLVKWGRKVSYYYYNNSKTMEKALVLSRRPDDDDERRATTAATTTTIEESFHLSFWEVESLKNRSICAPPSNNRTIPKFCCLGFTKFFDNEKLFAELRNQHCLDFNPRVHDKFVTFTRNYMKSLPTSIANNNNSSLLAFQETTTRSLLKKNKTSTAASRGGGTLILELTPFCYANANDDLCLLMQQLFRYNWTLCFFGDSLSLQQFWGLHCALAQRGFETRSKPQGKIWLSLPVAERPKSPGYGRIVSLQVTATTTTTNNNSITIVYNRQNLPASRRRRRAEPNAAILFCVEHYDIFVFDFGLHFRRAMTRFSDSMATMLESIIRSSNKTKRLKALVWRETTMQHFETRDGLYVESELDPNMTARRCVSLKNRSSSSSSNHHRVTDDVILLLRKNNDNNQTTTTTRTTSHLLALERAAHLNQMRFLNAFDLPPPTTTTRDDNNNDELYYVPMRSFQAPWHEMHRGQGDCTHWCHTPYFWLPLWRGLRLIVDRTVLQRDDE